MEEEGSASDHREWELALQELFCGQDAAADLRGCFIGTHKDEDGSLNVARADLAQVVVASFSKALSLLGYHDGTVSDGAAASSCLSSTNDVSPDQKPVIGGKKVDQRGRFKRWKSRDSWSEIAPALIDDGHAWRKYGQKAIHGSDFPRSYFRCTHKFEQNCEAAKQVQQISLDPPSYRTTYYGHHTCENTNSFITSRFILDDSNPGEGSMFNLVSFDGKAPRDTEDGSFFSSNFFPKSFKNESIGHMTNTSVE